MSLQVIGLYEILGRIRRRRHGRGVPSSQHLAVFPGNSAGSKMTEDMTPESERKRMAKKSLRDALRRTA
jgi:hypothetical protein